MQTPTPCGALSMSVAQALTVTDGRPRPAPRRRDVSLVTDPLSDRDFQLALWMLYELHYRGFEDVDPALEWDPLLISARNALEALFEEAVRALAGPPPAAPLADADDVVEALFEMTGSGRPSELAGFLQRRATDEQFREYLAQRAVYHLRESDPQSFVVPRVDGRAKAALAGLQFDEYGAGRADRLHATMYADALASLGLPTDVGAYLPEVDAATLASVNTMSMFALNRRLRGAALGHLAAFEATSSIPCRMIAQGARRLGLPEQVAAYYDEHVEADAAHEQIAIREICGGLVSDEPGLAADVVYGAAACLAVDAVAGEVLLARWRDAPLDAAGATEAAS